MLILTPIVKNGFYNIVTVMLFCVAVGNNTFLPILLLQDFSISIQIYNRLVQFVYKIPFTMVSYYCIEHVVWYQDVTYFHCFKKKRHSIAHNSAKGSYRIPTFSLQIIYLLQCCNSGDTQTYVPFFQILLFYFCLLFFFFSRIDTYIMNLCYALGCFYVNSFVPLLCKVSMDLSILELIQALNKNKKPPEKKTRKS